MNQRLARPVYRSEWEGEQKRLNYDFARPNRERSTSTTDGDDAKCQRVFISEFACVLIGCVADLN